MTFLPDNNKRQYTNQIQQMNQPFLEDQYLTQGTVDSFALIFKIDSFHAESTLVNIS